jgi:uncharacterized protein YbaP (TraB family)
VSQAAEATTSSEADPASDSAIEQITIQGVQPGPGLWKVTQGTHVLWILGTISSYPKGMIWRPEQVESAIASSKQILGGAQVSANVSRVRLLFMLRPILKARFNQDGAVLQDLLEPQVYARWLDLRKKYFDDDKDIERVRPMFIAFMLYEKATTEAGLTQGGGVKDLLGKVSKKYHVPIKQHEIKVDVGKPRDALAAFNATPREADVACLVAAIHQLDTDVEAMTKRANAWAVGDIATLRQIPEPAREGICADAITSAPGLQEKFEAAKEAVATAWFESVESALEKNDVTFAVLPMSEIFRADGRLAQLQERGYLIEPPSS